MKVLLIGLTLLSSMSSFADEIQIEMKKPVVITSLEYSTCEAAQTRNAVADAINTDIRTNKMNISKVVV